MSELFRTALREHRKALAESGLIVTPMQDCNRTWEGIIGSGRNPAFINPPIDKCMSLTVHRDAPVGVIAVRIHDVRSLELLVRSGRLWWSAAEAFERQDGLRTLELPDAFKVEGRIAQIGGLWVAPDARGHRIGWRLSRMARLCAYLLLDADHCVGFKIDYADGHWDRYYGNPRAVKIAESFMLPDETAPHEIWLSHESRAEKIAHLGTGTIPVHTKF